MFELFVNGVSWKRIPVAQNEDGYYFGKISNPDSLWKPALKDFNGAVPPAGYKAYSNGSHRTLPALRRIDLSCVGVITANQDVKINGYPDIMKGFSKPYGVNIMAYPNFLALNHTNCPHAVGTIVPAGQPIAYINTREQNQVSAGNFPSHLEVYTLHNNADWSKETVRELILKEEQAPQQPQNSLENRLRELEATVLSSSGRISELEGKLETLQSELNSMSIERSKYKNIIEEICQEIGYDFDFTRDFAIQKYGIREKIEGRVLHLSVFELLGIIINKLIKNK